MAPPRESRHAQRPARSCRSRSRANRRGAVRQRAARPRRIRRRTEIGRTAPQTCGGCSSGGRGCSRLKPSQARVGHVASRPAPQIRHVGAARHESILIGVRSNGRARSQAAQTCDQRIRLVRVKLRPGAHASACDIIRWGEGRRACASSYRPRRCAAPPG